jgi:hypothetical protein
MILETNCYVYIILLRHQYLKDHLLCQSDRCVRETCNKAHLFYAENKSNMMNENNALLKKSLSSLSSLKAECQEWMWDSCMYDDW